MLGCPVYHYRRTCTKWGTFTSPLQGHIFPERKFASFKLLLSCCLTLQGSILCSCPLFLCFPRMLSLWQLCESLEWVIVEYGSWVCCWGKQRILFDLIFLLQRDALKGFSSDHNCPLSRSKRIYAPRQTNKQIDHCKWSVCARQTHGYTC